MNYFVRRNAVRVFTAFAVACVSGVSAGCSPSGDSSQTTPAASTPPAADPSNHYYQLGEKYARTAIKVDGYSTSGLSPHDFCIDLEFPIQDNMSPDLTAILNQVPPNNTYDLNQFNDGCEAAARTA